MEAFLWFTLLIPFVYINLLIIKYDITYKSIPNKYLKYLLFLLPFVYSYYTYFWVFWSLNHWLYFIQILMAFVVCFLLFFYWLWWAGDAKYLLVLCLFTPQYWVLPIAWTIGMIILLYLLSYFIYFWVWKNFFLTNKKNIFKELISTYKKKQRLPIGTYIYQAIPTFFLFIIVFLIERLSRIYLIEKIYTHFETSPKEVLQKVLELENAIFILFLIIVIGIALGFYLIKYWIILLQEKLGYNLKFLIIFLLSSILVYISYGEIIWNTDIFMKKIFLIMTVYLWIYFWVRVLWEAYKITFKFEEETYIQIWDLKKWMVIDKSDLCLAFWSDSSVSKICNTSQTSLQIIKGLRNPLSQSDVNTVRLIYQWVHDHHITKKTPHYEKRDIIKISKTFALSPYIFLWFIVAFLNIPNSIFQNVINYVLY